MKDRALYDLIPLLIELSKVDDVRDAIPRFVRNNLVDFNLAMQVCDHLNSQRRAPETSAPDTQVY